MDRQQSLLYKEMLSSLNPEQRRAVETIEGPVMVVAGPGTGKTQVLTLRIAHIIATTDVGPGAILALTFTEAGARAMRDRLTKYIGQTARKVAIHTFHQFAGMLFAEYPDAFPDFIGAKVVSDLERIQIIEAILDHSDIKVLRPSGNPQYYLRPIGAAIADCKREYKTPHDLGVLRAQYEAELQATPEYHEKGAHKGKRRGEYVEREKRVAKISEFAFVYQRYEAELRQRQRYDFDDMLFAVVTKLQEDETLRLILQERFQYFLADEHQDVNGVQNRLLELLASYHEQPNLFVVGDEKQAIFRFQGASLDNFLYFTEQYPQATTIALTQNYRSGQAILDTAHTLITSVPSPADDLRIPLRSATLLSAKVEERSFTHEVIEDDSIVAQIQDLLQGGVSPQEIAVIVRSNKEVAHLTELLRAKGIQVDPSAEGDILEHPLLAALQTLLEAVTNPLLDETWSLLIHEPYWQLTADDRCRLYAARRGTATLWSVLAHVEEHIKDAEQEFYARVRRVTEVIDEARRLQLTEAPHRVLAMLCESSGLLALATTVDPIESGRIIRRLYDEVEAGVTSGNFHTLHDVAVNIASRRRYGLALNAPFTQSGVDAVQVLTAHKSKGLEYQHVFIPHVTDRRWGDTARSELFPLLTKKQASFVYDELDDERKLLYVAMTRAKEAVYLSYATHNQDNRLSGKSPLLEGYQFPMIQTYSVTAEEQEFSPTTALYTAPRKKSEALQHLVEAIIFERGISVTALNNYVDNPWTFLYRSVLRVPQVKSESALFGTLVHAVLRKAYRSDGIAPPTMIQSYIKDVLETLPLSQREAARLHERALQALIPFCDSHATSLPPMMQLEVPLESLISLPGFERPVKLVGTLDRIDFDMSGNATRVVDYKTGKPKSRGVITGTVQDGTGNYYRQLVFYTTLLAAQDDSTLHTEQGSLLFVEPTASGVYKEESFSVPSSDRQELLTLLGEMCQTLLSGEWVETLPPHDHEFFSLAERFLS